MRSSCYQRVKFEVTVLAQWLTWNTWKVKLSVATKFTRGIGDLRKMSEGQELPRFSVAFQPIVNVEHNHVCYYEALTRGDGGEGFLALTGGMSRRQLLYFDRLARMEAIKRAAELGLAATGARLSLNLLSPVDGLKYSALEMVEMAESFGFPANRLLIELNEGTHFKPQVLQHILAEHRRYGILTAIDDFGSGHSGLNLLALSRPEVVKIDMVLVRSIERDFIRQSIVRAFTNVCDSIGIEVIAEGVETAEELMMLKQLGVRRIQGYYFAKPSLSGLSVSELEAHGIDCASGAMDVSHAASWSR